MTWVDCKIELAMIHEVDHGFDLLRFHLLKFGAASFAFLRIVSTWLEKEMTGDEYNELIFRAHLVQHIGVHE